MCRGIGADHAAVHVDKSRSAKSPCIMPCIISPWTIVGRKFVDAEGQTKVFRGKVCDFSEPYWRVEYPDGDREELTRRELIREMSVTSSTPDSADAQEFRQHFGTGATRGSRSTPARKGGKSGPRRDPAVAIRVEHAAGGCTGRKRNSGKPGDVRDQITIPAPSTGGQKKPRRKRGTARARTASTCSRSTPILLFTR